MGSMLPYIAYMDPMGIYLPNVTTMVMITYDTLTIVTLVLGLISCPAEIVKLFELGTMYYRT